MNFTFNLLDVLQRRLDRRISTENEAVAGLIEIMKANEGQRREFLASRSNI